MCKVLIISPFENEFTDRGGRNVDLANLLSRSGHDVTLLTSNFNHSTKEKIAIPVDLGFYKFIRIHGYKRNISLSRFISHIEFSIKSYSLLKSDKFDVIFCSTIPPEISLLAKMLKSRKVVYDVRDIWPDALLGYVNTPKIIKWLFEKYCDFFYKLSFFSCAQFTVVAPTFLKWIRRYTDSSVSWKFIPLGFRASTWSCGNDSNIKYQYDYYYAGGITPQFNLDEFKRKLSGKIVFLGNGSSYEYIKECFPFAYMPGSVSRSDADLIMASSRYLVFPSNKNARLPNKAFDYFSSNKDVVLGANVSREVNYLFNNIYNKRRTSTDPDEFKCLSRDYAIKKLSLILLKDICE